MTQTGSLGAGISVASSPRPSHRRRSVQRVGQVVHAGEDTGTRSYSPPGEVVDPALRGRTEENPQPQAVIARYGPPGRWAFCR
jgi:hypothetical protein